MHFLSKAEFIHSRLKYICHSIKHENQICWKHLLFCHVEQIHASRMSRAMALSNLRSHTNLQEKHRLSMNKKALEIVITGNLSNFVVDTPKSASAPQINSNHVLPVGARVNQVCESWSWVDGR